ncbi:glycosyltransferase [Dehalobacter sp. TBBPA1]|uniref:glycosyltransferase n=1 Tax=Dehalobacter sp. TBBPA1 TaxID=3235037 RepID=UPI0034A1305D
MYNDAVNPLVSIVILGYNHLDYTKLAIDSIYQYSEGIDFELITVNNGSFDGTKKYFDSLPNKKKIHLDNNVGPVNGFNIGLKAAEGKYIAAVCNDFIFTKDWLKNLILCMESDEEIGFVAPAASNVSNFQQIPGNYKNIEEMQDFARAFNHSDPDKWEERVRLMPTVLFVKREVLDLVGYYDPKFYFGEFADDDMSFRIRRAGYKLVFAADTFTFHFGSITTGAGQKENKSLEVSRQFFIDKYNLDAWTDVHYDFDLLNLVDYEEAKGKSDIRILGIDPRCGATILQLKNKLRNQGQKDVQLFAFTKAYKYMTDLETICQSAICGNYHDISKNYTNEKFDYVIIGEPAQHYDHFIDLIGTLKTLLKENGQIILSVNNTMRYDLLLSMMAGMETGIAQNGYVKVFDLVSMEKELMALGVQVKKVTIDTNEVEGNDKVFLDNLADIFPEQAREVVKLRMKANRYFLSLWLA